MSEKTISKDKEYKIYFENFSLLLSHQTLFSLSTFGVSVFSFILSRNAKISIHKKQINNY